MSENEAPTDGQQADGQQEPEAPPPPPEWKRDPGLLKRSIARTTTSLNGKQSSKPTVRRRIEFRVEHTICEPDFFDDDFEVTCTSLSSHVELEAARAAKGDPVTMAMLMARASVTHVNGMPLSRASGEDEWFWNALGTAGRNLVMSMFVHIGTPGDEAMGKAATTLRIT